MRKRERERDKDPKKETHLNACFVLFCSVFVIESLDKFDYVCNMNIIILRNWKEKKKEQPLSCALQKDHQILCFLICCLKIRLTTTRRKFRLETNEEQEENIGRTCD